MESLDLTGVRQIENTTTSAAGENGLRIGPLTLAPGLTRIHAFVAIYASLTTMSLLVYINLVQPYLFAQVLNVPPSEYGSLTGRLAALGEIIAIVCMAIIGALSDQWGRRAIYATGFLLLSLGYFLYPLADSILQLGLFRVVFAAGGAMVLVMFTVLAIDFSQERSRGKWIGFLNLVSGVGVLLMTLFMTRIPGLLENAGYSGAVAGRYTFWTASALCLTAAAVLALGLRRGASRDRTTAGNPFATIATALSLAARNRRIALAYGAAFIGRGDLAIMGMFIPLWVSHVALEADMSAAEATARAGIMLFVHQLAVVSFAYVIGSLNDRLNKLNVVALAFGLASIGYISLWLIADPFAPLSLVAVIFVAIGDISIVVTNNVLAGEEASVESRGAVLGFLGVFGGIGISILTLAGGELFDSVGATAPFLMITSLNLLVIAAALLVKRNEHKRYART